MYKRYIQEAMEAQASTLTVVFCVVLLYKTTAFKNTVVAVLFNTTAKTSCVQLECSGLPSSTSNNNNSFQIFASPTALYLILALP